MFYCSLTSLVSGIMQYRKYGSELKVLAPLPTGFAVVHLATPSHSLALASTQLGASKLLLSTRRKPGMTNLVYTFPDNIK